MGGSYRHSDDSKFNQFQQETLGDLSSLRNTVDTNAGALGDIAKGKLVTVTNVTTTGQDFDSGLGQALKGAIICGANDELIAITYGFHGTSFSIRATGAYAGSAEVLVWVF